MPKILHETCQQYVERRLSEGWCIAGRWKDLIILSPPDGEFLRVVDLKNDILTIRPNAPGDATSLLPNPGTGEANWEDVDESTPDEDSTYVYNQGDTPIYDLYNLTDHTTEGGSINSVTVYTRCRATLANIGARLIIKTEGSIYEYPTNTTWWLLTTSYENYSYQWNTNPNTGAAWTWAQIDALQAGPELDNVAKQTSRCTQVYVEVDYTPGFPHCQAVIID